jgi:peptidoglycan/xylan/chitin deacetylase (PgdA/CDA1 family)
LVFYFATASGIGLAILSVAHQPPPMWIAVSALGGYVALVTLGVTFSRFSMFADVITMGPADAHGVALTFDDGPDPRSTPQILEQLDEAGVVATFFVIGRKVEDHPDLLREISARGHAIGIHSYAHERLMSLRSPWHVKRDLLRALEVVEAVIGLRPRLFRAPIGHISPAMARASRELELHVVGWTVRGVDGWRGAKPDDVAERIIRRLDDGVIALLHDASERGDFVPASIEALPRILEAADRRRLSFVRVDRWLDEEA